MKKISCSIAALTAVFAGAAAFAQGPSTGSEPALSLSKGQAYPSKPIRLIVPFAAGGGNDNVARLVGKRLSDGLGQQVVVDNRPGAGGVLGAELAAKAAPDGYTLFLGGVGSHAVNPNLHERLPYDPIRDFSPVALLASAPLILVVHPSVPVNSFAEFVAYARARPGQLNYASNGNGSSSQLAAVMFDSMAGVDMVHVPYKGLAPALADLLSGQVQLMFSSVVAILPHIKAGKLRGLAVTGRRRLASMPDLPTIAESGLPGYEASSWYGILAPAGTPRDIVQRLNAEIAKALDQPEVRGSLLAEGAEPVGGTPEQFATHIRSEKDRLGKLIREAKIRLE
ncbi:MAG TPA: tripartite tricarboxylate transporter substrate binding protein [Burkholderiales bacterium]|nr:tripartite tricarboxylate transporter substrate binding protein [Burkholderiales bacterium]